MDKDIYHIEPMAHTKENFFATADLGCELAEKIHSLEPRNLEVLAQEVFEFEKRLKAIGYHRMDVAIDSPSVIAESLEDYNLSENLAGYIEDLAKDLRKSGYEVALTTADYDKILYFEMASSRYITDVFSNKLRKGETPTEAEKKRHDYIGLIMEKYRLEAEMSGFSNWQIRNFEVPADIGLLERRCDISDAVYEMISNFKNMTVAEQDELMSKLSEQTRQLDAKVSIMPKKDDLVVFFSE